MSDLEVFLAARLDEDEAGARLAAREGGTWTQDDPERYPGAISSLGGAVVYDEGAPDEYKAAHIARHDPARALREVEAKRKIIAGIIEADAASTDVDNIEIGYGLADEWLRLFAAVWSDHPDYREMCKIR